MKEQGQILRKLTRILIPVLILVLGWFGYKYFFPERIVTVGFIYDNDETAPYSYNFYLAQEAVQKTWQKKVRTVMCSNVLDEQIHLSVQKLVDSKCDIVFTNSYGNIRDLAVKYPHIHGEVRRGHRGCGAQEVRRPGCGLAAEAGSRHFRCERDVRSRSCGLKVVGNRE